MTDPPVTYCETRYGFVWGAVEVGRCRYSRLGDVWITLNTPRQNWILHITPSGIVRVTKQKRRKRRQK